MITLPCTTSVSLSYFLPHSFFPRPAVTCHLLCVLSEISGNPAFWSGVEPPSPLEPHAGKLAGLCCCLEQPFPQPPGPASSPEDPGFLPCPPGLLSWFVYSLGSSLLLFLPTLLLYSFFLPSQRKVQSRFSLSAGKRSPQICFDKVKA